VTEVPHAGVLDFSILNCLESSVDGMCAWEGSREGRVQQGRWRNDAR
jgi:hypothetical protein